MGWVSERRQASIAEGSEVFDGQLDPWEFDAVAKLDVQRKFEIEILRGGEKILYLWAGLC